MVILHRPPRLDYVDVTVMLHIVIIIVIVIIFLTLVVVSVNIIMFECARVVFDHIEFADQFTHPKVRFTFCRHSLLDTLFGIIFGNLRLQFFFTLDWRTLVIDVIVLYTFGERIRFVLWILLVMFVGMTLIIKFGRIEEMVLCWESVRIKVVGMNVWFQFNWLRVITCIGGR